MILLNGRTLDPDATHDFKTGLEQLGSYPMAVAFVVAFVWWYVMGSSS